MKHIMFGDYADVIGRFRVFWKNVTRPDPGILIAQKCLESAHVHVRQV